jgi:hypothetical protein
MAIHLSARINDLRAQIKTEFGVDVPVRIYEEHHAIRLRLAHALTNNGWTAEYVQCVRYQNDPEAKASNDDNDARYVVVTEGRYAIVFRNRAEAMPDKSLRNVQMPRELVDIHVKRGFQTARILEDIKAALS